MIDAPGLRLRAIWTPGHAPGRLRFHDQTYRVLLTGDQVAPAVRAVRHVHRSRRGRALGRTSRSLSVPFEYRFWI
jgi:hypothetical protein